jgi:hypothetical protein
LLLIFLLFFGILFVIVITTDSAPGGGTNSPDRPAGFFKGIWHGWIAPISLILSIFDENIRIYEVHNIGFWYDFAFYAAIIGGFGSLSFARLKSN